MRDVKPLSITAGKWEEVGRHPAVMNTASLDRFIPGTIGVPAMVSPQGTAKTPDRPLSVHFRIV